MLETASKTVIVALVSAAMMTPVLAQTREVSRSDNVRLEQMGAALKRDRSLQKRAMEAMKAKDERKLRAITREAGVDIRDVDMSVTRFYCESGHYFHWWAGDHFIGIICGEDKLMELAPGGL